VEIGFCTGITMKIDSPIIKKYKIGSSTPALLAQGNQTFTVHIDKMYIDNTYMTLANTQTIVATIIFYPTGSTSTGDAKITLNNVKFNAAQVSGDAEGVVMEGLDGEGDSITLGTV